jgi:hypothetical protein
LGDDNKLVAVTLSAIKTKGKKGDGTLVLLPSSLQIETKK